MTSNGRGQVGRRGWKKFSLAFVALFASGLVMLFPEVLVSVLLPSDPLTGTVIVQIASAVVALLAMVLLGGRKWLRPSRESVSYAFRLAWPVLIIVPALIASIVYEVMAEGGVPGGVVGRVFPMLVLCLAIGVSEEALYRGVVLNGLLAPLGKSRKAVMAVVIVSSLIFGWAHVPGEDLSNPMVVAQAVLKVVQSGMFGVIMCAIVLHTRDIFGAALFHAVNDMLFMLPTAVMAGDLLDNNYTDATAGVEVLAVYGLMIAVMLYPTVRAIRTIWNEQESCRGAFMEEEEVKAVGTPVDPR